MDGATIIGVKKSLLDLRRNLMQPFLGAICPILIISDVRLEAINLIASSSKLIGKFFSGLSRRLEVCLSGISRPVNQPKNGVPRQVQLIRCRL